MEKKKERTFYVIEFDIFKVVFTRFYAVCFLSTESNFSVQHILIFCCYCCCCFVFYADENSGY